MAEICVIFETLVTNECSSLLNMSRTVMRRKYFIPQSLQSLA